MPLKATLVREHRYLQKFKVSAMELVIDNLPGVLEDGLNSEFRKNLALADTLAGSSLANAGAAAPSFR